MFSFAFSSKEATFYIQKLWDKNSTQISAVFTNLKLNGLDNIICYIHGISCEGWFDTDDNSIHIRFPKSGGDQELLDTIIHEIIHLVTYNKKFSYKKREAIVEKYMKAPEIMKILNQQLVD